MQFFCEWLLPEYWNLLEFQQNSIASILYFNKNPVFLNSYFKIVIDLFLNILIHFFRSPGVPLTGVSSMEGIDRQVPRKSHPLGGELYNIKIISKAGTSPFIFYR